ncbi:MAG: hypothetical protein J5621_05060 [Paludibacteraceae bacterium]|nr:hypothetical protein [Paludibacteraceae bacterium]
MSYSFSEFLPYYRRNLRLAFPVMVTQAGAALVGLFDIIMVGHYGTTDLAAVSFSNAITLTVMVFAMGALMGITPIVGYAVGAKEGGDHRFCAGAVYSCRLLPCAFQLSLETFGRGTKQLIESKKYEFLSKK